jgi:hypothetical protein
VADRRTAAAEDKNSAPLPLEAGRPAEGSYPAADKEKQGDKSLVEAGSLDTQAVPVQVADSMVQPSEQAGAEPSVPKKSREFRRSSTRPRKGGEV